MEKPIALIDVDGVVADLHTEWLKRYNDDYNDDLKYTQINKWSIDEFVKPECGRKIYEYLKTPDLYNYVPEVDGAVVGVNSLRAIGYRVVFLTAGFYTSKIEWLHNHDLTVEYPYGDNRWDTVTDVVIAGDKSLIPGTLMVDDRPENLRQGNTRFKVLFDQPWNRDATGYWRAIDWKEVIKFAEVHYGQYVQDQRFWLKD